MVVKATLGAIVLFLMVLAGCIDADDTGAAGGGPVAVIANDSQHYTVGADVTLDGTGSLDPLGGGLDYEWVIGEDSTRTGALVEHTFESTGNHTLILTVTDQQGNRDTASATVTLADDEYTQDVLFNWDTFDLDVLILHVEDPVVGGAIREAIQAWEDGIAELAPDISENLTIRVYWPGTGGVPPLDFEPDIYFVPVGAMAAPGTPQDGTCTAFAPVGYLAPDMTDLEEFYFTAAHEFGHCLGLGHVSDIEGDYAPAFDLLGPGSVHNEWGKSCPSNLNIIVLRMAFNGEQGEVTMPATQYHQSDC